MKKVSDKGIILARINFGEKDRILTVLSQNGGKIRLIAKGVRSSKSKLAGGIELLSESHLGYIEGRGEVFTLTSSRLAKHFGNIVQDYDKTEFAYDMLKTVNKVVDDGHGQEYYPLLISTLGYLNDDSCNCDSVAIWFYLHLLELMGSSINLKTNSGGKRLEESAKYLFDWSKNCFNPDERGIFSKQAIKLLRVAITSTKPIKTNMDKVQSQQTHQLLRQVAKEIIK